MIGTIEYRQAASWQAAPATSRSPECRGLIIGMEDAEEVFNAECRNANTICGEVHWIRIELN